VKKKVKEDLNWKNQTNERKKKAEREKKNKENSKKKKLVLFLFFKKKIQIAVCFEPTWTHNLTQLKLHETSMGPKGGINFISFFSHKHTHTHSLSLCFLFLKTNKQSINQSKTKQNKTKQAYKTNKH